MAGEHGAPAPASTAGEPPAPLEELAADEEDDEPLAPLDAGEPPAPLDDEAPLLEDAAATAPPTPEELGELVAQVPVELAALPPRPPLRLPEPVEGTPPPGPVLAGLGEVAHAANHTTPTLTKAPTHQALKRLTRL